MTDTSPSSSSTPSVTPRERLDRARTKRDRTREAARKADAEFQAARRAFDQTVIDAGAR